MKLNHTISLLPVMAFLWSCSAKIVSKNFYQEHGEELQKIEQNYKRLYSKKPFSLAFTNKDLSKVSVEMITDSLTYIYDFEVSEKRLSDTLHKYGLEADSVLALIGSMQKVSCTWINNFDYYVNDNERRLIFISIKPVVVRYPLSPPKYYIIAYFERPQTFDEKGRLLDGRRASRLRKLNGQVFHKITDRVCYTIAEKYR
ncbi:hypothetical protein [Ferruginibacter sp. HRS2-29]|uniref:hypothetical protein n=1 Tax=Ferruginibacter sp. HRS2-29 TaxID=2487334 RepID=UPI0020CB7B15|nr:hypothetical protein [Ferruginibacter sp. HRS2-29]MCP9753391.1 hypothetical protein [Ferruginibacter sp. HRS2-29]